MTSPKGPNVDMTRGVYRRIYSGFLWGKRISTVSMEAEAWFWRLHAVADDYGNFPADDERLAHEAGGRRKIPTENAKALNTALAKARLIFRYSDAGDDFYHIEGFEEFQPAGKSGRRIQRVPMHPVHPGESGGIQGNPGESGGVSPSETETETETESKLAVVETPPPECEPANDPRTDPVLIAVSPPPKVRKPREPDPLWDAVAAQFWPGGVPKPDAARCGRIVRDLRQHGAEPADVPLRVKRFASKWPGITVTPEALLKHWVACNGYHGAKPYDPFEEAARSQAAAAESRRR